MHHVARLHKRVGRRPSHTYLPRHTNPRIFEGWSSCRNWAMSRTAGGQNGYLHNFLFLFICTLNGLCLFYVPSRGLPLSPFVHDLGVSVCCCLNLKTFARLFCRANPKMMPTPPPCTHTKPRIAQRGQTSIVYACVCEFYDAFCGRVSQQDPHCDTKTRAG